MIQVFSTNVNDSFYVRCQVDVFQSKGSIVLSDIISKREFNKNHYSNKWHEMYQYAEEYKTKMLEFFKEMQYDIYYKDHIFVVGKGSIETNYLPLLVIPFSTGKVPEYHLNL